jgi:hypothetical protein
MRSIIKTQMPLVKQFHLTREQAQQIVKIFQTCAQHLPLPLEWVNPHGIQPRSIWQMDVTPSFGHLRFVHIIDTYSAFIYASTCSSEATKPHCLSTFTIMGKPHQIKTDKGPGYT